MIEYLLESGLMYLGKNLLVYKAETKDDASVG